MSQRFPLARMSAGMVFFTVFSMVLVGVFFYAGLREPEFRAVGFATALLLSLLIIAVYLLMRPVGFDVTPDALTLQWPLSSRRISRAALAEAKVVTRRELRDELGFMVRVGVGGLFGTFGWMLTPKGRYEVWSSTLGDCVVLKRNDGGLPILLTPADPRGFVRALRASGPSE